MPEAKASARSAARRSRRTPTFTEAALWPHLRDRRLDGLKFRRQVAIDAYIADYACLEFRLIIELDGGIHDLKTASDLIRDARLTALGYTVLRFRNEPVLRKPNLVFEAVRKHVAEARARLTATTPHPTGSAGYLLPTGEKDPHTIPSPLGGQGGP